MSRHKLNLEALESRLLLHAGGHAADTTPPGIDPPGPPPFETPSRPTVISVEGIADIDGQTAVMHALVAVPAGADVNLIAQQARTNLGARPIQKQDFSTIALYWDQIRDGDSTNDFVPQFYNPTGEPASIDDFLIDALIPAQATWTAVSPSEFGFAYAGTTSRCPSLVKECPGRQTFDGYNDIQFLSIKDRNTLAVTWSGTTIDEADIGINTRFGWTTDGTDFDIQTVVLHEEGHALGLGHSNVVGAVMEPTYAGERRTLVQDDIDGVNFLYAPVGQVNEAPEVTITAPTNGDSFASGGVPIDFLGSASDTEDGDLSVSLSWDSSIDGFLGSGSSITAILSDGVHTITASVADSDLASGEASITITVGTPLEATTVSVTDISYATEGGRNGDKHLLVTVELDDDLGVAVSGATVSIELFRDGNSIGTATGITGAEGAVTFNLKNALSGSYTTVVTDVADDDLNWDGLSPSNGFDKP